MRQSRPTCCSHLVLLCLSRLGYASAASAITLDRAPHARSLPTSRPPPELPADPLATRPDRGSPGRDDRRHERLHHQGRWNRWRTQTGRAVHLPSGTQYRALARTGGAYSLLNMRVGALPGDGDDDRVPAEDRRERLPEPGRDQAGGPGAEAPGGPAGGDRGDGGCGRRSWTPAAPGAATYISPEQVEILPSIKRSTRDLTRPGPAQRRQLRLRRPELALQQRLAGRILLQQPVRPRRSGAGRADQRRAGPYDAVEQVQVSLAPFDVGGRFHRREHQHRDQERDQRSCGARSTASGGTRPWRATRSGGQRSRGQPRPQVHPVGLLAQRADHPGQAVLLRERRARADRRPGSNFVASTNGAPGSGSRGCGGHHGPDPPADDRRLRLRSGRLPGLHQRDRQRQGASRSWTGTSTRTTTSRSGTTTWTPAATCRRTRSC